jgi:hypothetical protein
MAVTLKNPQKPSQNKATAAAIHYAKPKHKFKHASRRVNTNSTDLNRRTKIKEKIGMLK